MATLGVFLQFLPLAEALIPERWLAPLGWSVPIPGLRDMMQIARTLEEKSLEIYTKKKAALLQGDEALAMQVGEGKDIMSVLRESVLSCSRFDFDANFGMRTISAGEHGRGRGGQARGERAPRPDVVGIPSNFTVRRGAHLERCTDDEGPHCTDTGS